MHPNKYKGKHWDSLQKGAHSGQFGGITFLLDIESLDYSHTVEEAVGLRIAFSDQRDMPMIKQNGYMISPGIKRQQN
jgi:hypothetical protein